MTEFSLAKVEAAKKSGRWKAESRPRISEEVPQELARALARDRKARSFFAGLAPSCRRAYIGWISTAKKPETRARRAGEAVALLHRGRKLGLK